MRATKININISIRITEKKKRKTLRLGGQLHRTSLSVNHTPCRNITQRCVFVCVCVTHKRHMLSQTEPICRLRAIYRHTRSHRSTIIKMKLYIGGKWMRLESAVGGGGWSVGSRRKWVESGVKIKKGREKGGWKEAMNIVMVWCLMYITSIHPSCTHPLCRAMGGLELCYDWSGGGAHPGQVGSASVRHNTIQCGLSHLHQEAIYCYSQPCRANSNKYPAASQQQLSQLPLSQLCNWRLYPFIYTNHQAEVPGCLFASWAIVWPIVSCQAPLRCHPTILGLSHSRCSKFFRKVWREKQTHNRL